MTLMRIREITTCTGHGRTTLVLEDVAQQLVLTFYADPDEARRLAREIARARCACHPVYDFVEALVQAFQATTTRAVLDDVNGQGIGGFVYFRGPESQIGVPCYPPDALALALRANAPIYATPGALAHAEPLSPSPRTPDVRQWVARVKPEDFS